MQEKKQGRLADIAFDIRTVIGGLFLVYGLACLVWGLVSFTAEASAKTGGVNLNLWTGIGMLVMAAAFITWVLAKPLHPEDDPAAREALEDSSAQEEGR